MKRLKAFFRPLHNDILYKDNKLSICNIIFLLVISIAAITVCSKSSPLYPMNNWDDANCFFTVGKSVMNGRVLYRDIFEQKGPLLYFIYSCAYLISDASFLGVYFIEIASCFMFMIFSAKIIMLFCEKRVIYYLPLVAAFIFGSAAFEQGGSAEELCLPLIACCVYFGLKAVLYRKKLSYFQWFVTGVFSGMVLWIKFSLLGFYIGMGAFMLVYYFRNHWHKKILPSLFFLVAGEAAASLPVMIYFIMNNSLKHLFEVYFYCNLFIYPVNESGSGIMNLILNLNNGFFSFVWNFGACLFCMVLGMVYLFIRSKSLFAYYLSTSVFSFLLLYAGGRRYTYYSFILAVFAPMGLVMIYKTVQLLAAKKKKVLSHLIIYLSAAAAFFISIGFMAFISPNTYMISYAKEELPQYKFNDIISKTEDATVLNYKFLDGGFYTVGRNVPEWRFFCGLNIPYSVDEQDKYIAEGKMDYIITCNEKYDFERYECISSESFESRKDSFNTYYLYKKID